LCYIQLEIIKIIKVDLFIIFYLNKIINLISINYFLYFIETKKIMNKKRNQGFTLLEILLAVAALVILASIVILAINPGKQLADTRNAQRSADVNTIINAVYQYAIDNDGVLPAAISEETAATATTTDNCLETSVASGCSINLATDLVPDYLVEIPSDPRATVDLNYMIYKDTVNGDRIVVSVPVELEEQGKSISVTR
jgi:type IV pilus assembly protein PilA